MTDPAASIPTSNVRRLPLAEALPLGLILVAFALLFYKPAMLLVRDWWNDPEAGHGLLLAPAAVWLACTTPRPAGGWSTTSRGCWSASAC